jgi:hypothetical protein
VFVLIGENTDYQHLTENFLADDADPPVSAGVSRSDGGYA